jgi:putative tryptophan/tyrosine transport system substrate-binding protein
VVAYGARTAAGNTRDRLSQRRNCGRRCAVRGGFRGGLDEGGYSEKRNVEILFRYADERFDRLPMLASDLVLRRVAVIVASGTAPALAAKAATTMIPIVFETVNDPVAIGLVARFNRPGGNITGTSLMVEAYYAKGVELLHELLPHAGSIALLINPTNPSYDAATVEMADAARARGLRLAILKASNSGEFEQVFKAIAEEGLGAQLVSPDRLFAGHYDQLATLALRYRVPWIARTPQAARAGRARHRERRRAGAVHDHLRTRARRRRQLA